MIPQVFWLFVVCFKNKSIFDDRNIYPFTVQYTARYEEHIKGNILIIKITANVIVISLLRTFRPSPGAIFNEQKKLTRFTSWY